MFDRIIRRMADGRQWDYEREEAGDEVTFTFYGQSGYFRGHRHRIGRVIIPPDGKPEFFRSMIEFSISKSDEQARLAERGHDPKLASDPGLFTFELPEEEEMLPAKVVLAAIRQWEIIRDTLGAEIERAQAQDPAGVANGIDDAISNRLQLKPAGRKSDVDYDAAFERIKAGQPLEEAFSWVMDQRGINNPGNSERKSFRKAMKRRDRRTK